MGMIDQRDLELLNRLYTCAIVDISMGKGQIDQFQILKSIKYMLYV